MKVDKTKWRVCRLEDICAIQMGSSPDSSSYNKEQDGLPFYQGNADFGALYPTPRVFCNSPIRIAEKNDLLISVRAPIGAINLANSLCAIGRGLASIKPYKEYSNINFLRYLLISSRDELNRKGTGVTFKAISKSSLFNLQVTVPPLSEQTAIASELDSLQTVIDGYKAQLADLDALAQSVFLEMFGDPVGNPKGWEINSLANISNNKGTYGACSPSSPKEGDRPRYIRITDIDDTGNLNDDFVVSSNIDDDTAYLLQYGDILFARTGATAGKTYLYKGNNPQIYAGYLIKFSINTQLANPVYVYHITRTDSYWKWIRNQMIGAAQPNVNAKKYGALPIPLPPLPLQTQFASRVEAIERQKEQIRQQLKDAETLMGERMQYYFG